ncbi:MAG: thiol-disulfide oxidoreductase DCC family protein [Halanaeroarchaeum sp.]
MTSPLLVYDDDCTFCTDAARALAARGDLRIVGFGDLSADLRDRLPDDYRTCAHLVTEDAVYSCGEAVERAFAHRSTAGSMLVSTARRVPGYPALREAGYRLVANNRHLYGRAFD